MSKEGEPFVPLGEELTRTLIAAAQQGDFNAKERLSEANLRLVRSIARRFYLYGRDAEDLVQVGCIGLLKAIERFDFSYDVCFSTYAVPLIMGEIRRFLRDDRPVSVSRSLQETAIKLEQKRNALQHQWGAEPELWQLAEACGISEEQALAAIEAVRPPLSIHESYANADRESKKLEDSLPSAKDAFGDGFYEQLDLEVSLRALPARLQEIIRCRYFSDMTQVELARQMGVSQVQISRLEKQALAALRSQLAADNTG